MAYTGKKPIDVVDVTQSQSLEVTDDLTVDTDTLHVDSADDRVAIGHTDPQKTLDVKGTFAISNNTSSYWDFDRDDSTGALTISDTGTKRWEILTNGNLKAATNGLGIDFSASEGSGASSSVLNDYEEGTWTPAYGVHTGTNPTYTYGTQEGRYTKIGNLVIAHFEILTTARSGSSTNALTVTGLPFTVNSFSWQAGTIGYANNWVTNEPTKMLAELNNTRARFYYSDSGDSTFIMPNHIDASASVHLYATLIYRV